MGFKLIHHRIIGRDRASEHNSDDRIAADWLAGWTTDLEGSWSRSSTTRSAAIFPVTHQPASASLAIHWGEGVKNGRQLGGKQEVWLGGSGRIFFPPRFSSRYKKSLGIADGSPLSWFRPSTLIQWSLSGWPCHPLERAALFSAAIPQTSTQCIIIIVNGIIVISALHRK